MENEQELTPRPEHEAQIVQAHQHHAEATAQRDALIHQADRNNPVPVLEAMIVHNDKNTKAILVALKSLEDAIMKLTSPPTPDLSTLPTPPSP